MQPSDTDVGHAVKVVVHVQDSQGRRVETCDTLIAVAIKPQSPSMSLGGGKSTRMCHAGEVAFDDLFIDTPGAGVQPHPMPVHQPSAGREMHAE